MEDKNIYAEYAELQSKIKELEARQDELKEEMMDQLAMAEAQTLKTNFGTFSIVERKTYTYTPELKDSIRKMQEQEVEEGKATLATSKSLRFQALKSKP